jgi:tetratricopeptide (TPR) repeat protein
MNARPAPWGTLTLVTWALVLAVSACTPDNQRSPSSAAPAASPVATNPATAPADLVLPDLAAIAAPVQQQIRARYQALTSAGPEVGPDERARRYGDLGNVLLAATFFDEAALCYAHAEALQANEMRWSYLRAHALVRKGDRDGAARAFERVVALQPTYVPALVWLGDMYLDLERSDAAQEAFARALAQRPDSPAALFGAGRAALARAAYADAARQMEHALRVDPRATAINYPLAMAYRGLGERERADALLKTRGSTAPGLEDPVLDEATIVLDSAVSYESAGMQALRHQDWAAAIDAFRRGLAFAPDDPSLRYWMASAMIASGDAGGAEREFRAITAQHPDYAKAHFSLGAILDQQGQREEASREYERAVRTDPTLVDARLRLADSLRAQRQLRPAMIQYEAAVNLDPNAVGAWIGGAQTLIALGERDRARDWIARGRRLHPSRPEWAAMLLETK